MARSVTLTSTTAARTIAALREMFSRYGLPKQLVSDNGPQFTSQEFACFMAKNGVKHIRTSPYHPASNGAVERLVQSVKRGVKAGIKSGVPFECALQAFLLRYRTTPHTTTGITPSTLMLGWDVRTHLDLLRPELQERVEEKQAIQSRYHNRHCKGRELATGTAVWAHNWRDGPAWVRARVHDSLGPVSYLVELENGDLWRRHIDHLRTRPSDIQTDSSLSGANEPDTPPADAPTEGPETPMPDRPEPTAPPVPEPSQHNAPPSSRELSNVRTPPLSNRAQPTVEPETTNQHYPTRSRQPPERLYARWPTEQN